MISNSTWSIHMSPHSTYSGNYQFVCSVDFNQWTLFVNITIFCLFSFQLFVLPENSTMFQQTNSVLTVWTEEIITAQTIWFADPPMKFSKVGTKSTVETYGYFFNSERTWIFLIALQERRQDRILKDYSVKGDRENHDKFRLWIRIPFNEWWVILRSTLFLYWNQPIILFLNLMIETCCDFTTSPKHNFLKREILSMTSSRGLRKLICLKNQFVSKQ